MARPKKQGLDYFPFDVDFFSNKKIKILKSRYHTDGVIIYIYLLCEIYKNGYYIIWDEDYKFIVADDLNLSDGLIEQVIAFLVKRSLLTSILLGSDTALTSPGIQSRFQEAVKPRASKSPVSVIKELWLLTKEKTQGFIKVINLKGFSENNPCFSENNPDNFKNNSTKESKVKKSKVKEGEDTPSPYGRFQNVFLTNNEISELKRKYPIDYQEKIEELSSYMKSNGKHYQSHFATLIRWIERKGVTQPKKEKNSSIDYDKLNKLSIPEV